MTQSPTRDLVLSPQWTNGRPRPSILSRARSDVSSRPTIRAGIFLAVGRGDGDGIDSAGAGQALDQVVVGDDVAVGRNDEARAERAGLAGARLRRRCCRLRSLPLLPCGWRRGRTGGRIPRTGRLCAADRDALLGRNVDHRGLQLGDEVGERHRRAAGAGPAPTARSARPERRPGPWRERRPFPPRAGPWRPHRRSALFRTPSTSSILHQFGVGRKALMSPSPERRLNAPNFSASVQRIPSDSHFAATKRWSSARAFSWPSPTKVDLIALHRPVEIVEIGVLAEARGISSRGVGVGLGADDLCLLGALGADRARLLLARGAHAVECGLQAARRRAGRCA